MADASVYLDTYVLQQSILSNLDVEKGKTKFDIYLDADGKSLVLKIHDDNGGNNDE